MLTSSSPLSAPTPEVITTRAALLVEHFPTLAKQPKFEQTITRAQAIAARTGAIVELQPGVFAVQSERQPETAYTVDTNAHTCTCPAHAKFPDRTCKHRLAIALYVGWEQPAPAAAPTVEAPPEVEPTAAAVHGHLNPVGFVSYNHPFHGLVDIAVELLGMVVRNGHRVEYVRALNGQPFDHSGFFGPDSTEYAYFAPGSFRPARRSCVPNAQPSNMPEASRALADSRFSAAFPGHVNKGNKKLASNE